MSTSSAQRLLHIYQIRLRLIEKGLAKPKPEIVAGVKKLVAGLSEMQPDDMVGHEIQDGKVCFKVVTTGDLIAEFPFIPN
jgi:hypothetical protein